MSQRVLFCAVISGLIDDKSPTFASDENFTVAENSVPYSFIRFLLSLVYDQGIDFHSTECQPSESERHGNCQRGGNGSGMQGKCR